MTISQYVAKFNTLARFAPGAVSTETERMDKFEEGLRVGLQKMMAAHPYNSYAKIVDGAKRAEAQEQRERQIYGSSKPDGAGGGGGQKTFVGKKRGKDELGSGEGV